MHIKTMVLQRQYSSLAVSIVLAGIVVVMTLAALVIPSRGARGYGECTAPTRLSHEQNPHHSNKIKLSWGEYDFSVCDDELTTKSYEVEVREIDGTLLVEKTKTRSSEFSVPNPYQNIKWKKIGFHKEVKFRVRTVADDETTSGWSDYYEFTTRVQNPDLDLFKWTHDEAAGTANVKFSWTQIKNPTDFKFYRVRLEQDKYTPISDDQYKKATTTLFSTKVKDIDSTEKIVENLREYKDVSGEAPYDEYYYKAAVFAVYRIDGEKVQSEKSISNFGISFGGSVFYSINPPSGDEVISSQL